MEKLSSSLLMSPTPSPLHGIRVTMHARTYRSKMEQASDLIDRATGHIEELVAKPGTSTWEFYAT
jgi:hypothetical protein